MNPYHVILVLDPTKEELKAGQSSQILGGVKTILAKDEKMAAMLAGREISDEHVGKAEHIRVFVRPF